MLKLLALCLVSVALGQLFCPGRLVLDRVSGYRVEYDDRANVVLLISDSECYIVEAADTTWDALVRNHDELHAAALDIVKLIDSKTGVTATTFRESETKYHSRLEEFQCAPSPSPSSATPPALPAPPRVHPEPSSALHPVSQWCGQSPASRNLSASQQNKNISVI
ncbi:uncharacterized protein LOC112575996 isoform X2 [Pomacea canaliculata]|uniref:uncharacterized protein LOC112575996 isoform X2 n=1 Tax=Pomacea canaliculata TaxID=400727 RepID=UPI000D72BBA5|nr:uncharacterized protein LOC112575996 isoform X2 [Pomacea canaliculata]